MNLLSHLESGEDSVHDCRGLSLTVVLAALYPLQQLLAGHQVCHDLQLHVCLEHVVHCDLSTSDTK